jgi:hypothetical protein
VISAYSISDYSSVFSKETLEEKNMYLMLISEREVIIPFKKNQLHFKILQNKLDSLHLQAYRVNEVTTSSASQALGIAHGIYEFHDRSLSISNLA